MLWVILKRKIGTILDRSFIVLSERPCWLHWSCGVSSCSSTSCSPGTSRDPSAHDSIYLVLCVFGGATAFFTAAFLAGSPEIVIMLQVRPEEDRVERKGDLRVPLRYPRQATW